MAKSKSAFFCKNCGYESAKWLGNCPSCKEWNTFVEEITTKKEENKSWKGSSKKTTPKKLSDIDRKNVPRIVTSDAELNRVLGGGIIPGSLILLGGEPGIGKSTLMLQIALTLRKSTLYVSGEESEQQIKMRAERLEVDSDTA